MADTHFLFDVHHQGLTKFCQETAFYSVHQGFCGYYSYNGDPVIISGCILFGLRKRILHCVWVSGCCN